MITLAFLLAGWVAQTRAEKAGVDGYRLTGLYVVLFLSGLAGARLLHFLMAEPEHFFADPLVYFRFWEGGFAFYGGAILGTLCGILYARLRGVDIWRLADLCAPPLMLGLGIGRIGCFLAGCCHGAARALPESFLSLLPGSFSGGALYVMGQPPFLLEEFRHGVGLNNTPMLPTHLWESVGALLLFAVLSWRWSRRRYDGQVFAWLMLLYPVLRSAIELFRGDTIRGVGWFGFLSTSQLLSIPIFALGLLLVVLRRRRGLRPVERVDDDQELLREIAGDA
jgi:phosphatidylglycerol:prolipoprotein diacylglycerol transferase